MAARMDGLKCESCDGVHDFCLADEAEFALNGRYRAVCPVNEEAVFVTPTRPYARVRRCPESAIGASRVDDEREPPRDRQPAGIDVGS